MIKLFGFCILFSLISLMSIAQADTIRMKNPSFEDKPKRGGEDGKGILGWYDCGELIFPLESPPDIHPNEFWGNNLPASNGKTYLGMVVRDNNTFESVSCRLDTNLIGGQSYKFSINLARASNYKSLSRSKGKLVNYITPAILSIWGGTLYCDEKELLAESSPIENEDWKKFDFILAPKTNIKNLTIQVYYAPNSSEPYNGNMLIDDISNIIRIPEK